MEIIFQDCTDAYKPHKKLGVVALSCNTSNLEMGSKKSHTVREYSRQNIIKEQL